MTISPETPEPSSNVTVALSSTSKSWNFDRETVSDVPPEEAWVVPGSPARHIQAQASSAAFWAPFAASPSPEPAASAARQAQYAA